MLGYIIRRIGQAIIVILGVTLIVFFMSHLIPGGEARAVLRTRATPEAIRHFNRANGFNLPIWRQYFNYLWNVLHGRLGFSYHYDEPVASVIEQYMPRTLVLVGVSTVFALVVAIPLGVMQAVRRNKPADYVATGFSFILYAMPAFLLGTLLIIWFCFDLKIFPVSPPSTGSAWEIFSDPKAFVLPILTLSAITIAAFSRYMRSSMLDAMAEDYIRTATAKGAGKNRILYGHALRNALIPILTLLGLTLPAIVSGAVITEEVFNYPGMGYATVEAAINTDIPLVLGTTLVITIATVIGSLLADVLYAVADRGSDLGG